MHLSSKCQRNLKNKLCLNVNFKVEPICLYVKVYLLKSLGFFLIEVLFTICSCRARFLSPD